MTTSLLTAPLSSLVTAPIKRKRVLLMDASPATRELRAGDKAERRNQRKQEKTELSPDDEMRELREYAEAQAALFRVGPPSRISSSRQMTTRKRIRNRLIGTPKLSSP